MSEGALSPCGHASNFAITGREEDVRDFIDSSQPLSLDAAFARIAQGGMFLDRVLPGWREYVNRDVLNFRCGDHTLLGQIGRGDRRLRLRERSDFTSVDVTYFDLTRVALGLTIPDTERLGFIIEPQESDLAVTLGSAQLHRAWPRFLR